MSKASIAYEAFLDGKFSLSVELLKEYMNIVPEDYGAYLALGDYLVCGADKKDSAAAYTEFAKRGGDKNTALHRILQNIPLLFPDVVKPEFIDCDLILEHFYKICDAGFFTGYKEKAFDITSNWNNLRKGFQKRKNVYEKFFSEIEQNSDIAFIITPFLQFNYGYPPYGIGILQNYLSKKNMRSVMADINLEMRNAFEEYHQFYWDSNQNANWRNPYRFSAEILTPLWHDYQTLAELCANLNTMILGFSCYFVNRLSVIDFAQRIKSINPDKFIALGGPDCFYPLQCKTRYNQALDKIDAFVVGEGEITLENLINNLKSKSDYKNIPGIYTCKNNEETEFVRPAPLPKEELKGFYKFPVQYVNKIPEPRFRLTSLSRGCVNHCDFCYDRKAWQKFRMRDIADIIEEMKFSIEEYGITKFYFVDSAINSSIKHLEELCDAIIAQITNTHEIEIVTSIMVSEKMTEDLYKKMYKAGFRILDFGLESGSDKVLNAMRKRGGSFYASKNLELSHKAGIKNVIFIITGHPSEEKKDFFDTVNFIKKNREFIAGIEMVNTCFALHDTDLKNALLAENVYIPENFPDFGSWAYKDNNIFERLKRKDIIIKEARSIGIPVHAEPFYKSKYENIKSKIKDFLRKHLMK